MLYNQRYVGRVVYGRKANYDDENERGELVTHLREKQTDPNKIIEGRVTRSLTTSAGKRWLRGLNAPRNATLAARVGSCWALRCLIGSAPT